jgi:hypothetical protein
VSEKNININDGAANDEELDFMLGRKRKQAPYSKEEKPTVMPGAASLGGRQECWCGEIE